MQCCVDFRPNRRQFFGVSPARRAYFAVRHRCPSQSRSSRETNGPMPGADTFGSLAAPPMVAVTISARITSIGRGVIIFRTSESFPNPRRHQWCWQAIVRPYLNSLTPKRPCCGWLHTCGRPAFYPRPTLTNQHQGQVDDRNQLDFGYEL